MWMVHAKQEVVVVVTKQTPKAKGRPENTSETTKKLLQTSRQYALAHGPLDSATPTDLLPTEATPQPGAIRVQDLMLSELQAARMLNMDMPDDPKQFIQRLETRIQELTGTRKNVILILDEESGTYTCLNDEADDHFATAPRELTWISDTYLQDLLGSEQVMHSFLHHQGSVFGIVAIADKQDGTAFGLHDELILEQLTQYLSVQVSHFLILKRSMALPTIQRMVLRISNQLLSAVDSPAIFQEALSLLCAELPFNAGHYIQLDRNTGKGQVLYQLLDGAFEQGDPVLREVDSFVPLLSLFQSRVWKHPYLYLKSDMLGDTSFSEMFGVPGVASVLLLPLVGDNHQVNGALVLFQQGQAVPLSKEALTVVEQVSELVVSACGRARILEKALEIATTDELTGAMNRRGFYNRFDAEVDRARRNQTPMCLVMLDVDHFKAVNDTYGHLAGDQVLRQMARHLRKNIRKSDVLCRFGGEEFALLLPETSVHAASDLLERLRRKVEKLGIQTEAGTIHVTFSAGLDRVDARAESAQDPMQVISESLARADEALYEAKQLGRNRLIVVEHP